MKFKTLKMTFKPAARAVVLTMALTSQTSAQTDPTIDTAPQVQLEAVSDKVARFSSARLLPVLSQGIPASGCFLHEGIRPQHTSETLDASVAEFHSALTLLVARADSSQRSFRSAESRELAELLSRVDAKFAPIEAAIAAKGSGPIDVFTMQVLADHNIDLMRATKLVLDKVSGGTIDAIVQLPPRAIAIEIAARQVMLAQRMAKDVCLAIADIDKDRSLEDLRNTIGMFEISLHALQHGMASAGLQHPPNQDITENLALVQFEWATQKGLVDIVLDGGTLSKAECEEVFEGLEAIRDDMNAVVDMYIAASLPGS